MQHPSELFWQASLAEIMQGYVFDEAADEYVCLICGKRIARGVIYPWGDVLYEAAKFTGVHIAAEHGSPFNYLINLDKKLTGLTEHQKNLLELFHQGLSDQEVARATGAGSTSTIRNHRFALREKHKQAKVFAAIMQLLENRLPQKQNFIDIPASTRQVDERFAITTAENEGILAAYFKEGPDGPLTSFPNKEKRRVAVLKHLLRRFDPTATYTEKEVNAILQAAYHDYVLLRRLLVDYGFLDRKTDGSAYWLKP